MNEERKDVWSRLGEFNILKAIIVLVILTGAIWPFLAYSVALVAYAGISVRGWADFWNGALGLLVSLSATYFVLNAAYGDAIHRVLARKGRK